MTPARKSAFVLLSMFFAFTLPSPAPLVYRPDKKEWRYYPARTTNIILAVNEATNRPSQVASVVARRTGRTGESTVNTSTNAAVKNEPADWGFQIRMGLLLSFGILIVLIFIKQFRGSR